MAAGKERKEIYGNLISNLKEVTVILINSSGVDFKAHLLLYKYMTISDSKCTGTGLVFISLFRREQFLQAKPTTDLRVTVISPPSHLHTVQMIRF